jgi:hypothetical protein
MTSSNKKSKPRPTDLDLSRLASIRIEHDIFKYLSTGYMNRTNLENELLDLETEVSDEQLAQNVRGQVNFFRVRSLMNDLSEKSLHAVCRLNMSERKPLYRVQHRTTGIEMVKKVEAVKSKKNFQ